MFVVRHFATVRKRPFRRLLDRIAVHRTLAVDHDRDFTRDDMELSVFENHRIVSVAITAHDLVLAHSRAGISLRTDIQIRNRILRRKTSFGDAVLEFRIFVAVLRVHVVHPNGDLAL